LEASSLLGVLDLFHTNKIDRENKVILSTYDKCLVSNEVTQDMEKRNKFMNGVASEVASVGIHEGVGIDGRSRRYQ
jgi:hypothetical protein